MQGLTVAAGREGATAKNDSLMKVLLQAGGPRQALPGLTQRTISLPGRAVSGRRPFRWRPVAGLP